MPDKLAAAAAVDLVAHDAPGSREIGFSVPDHHNASAILFDNLMGAGSVPPASA